MRVVRYFFVGGIAAAVDLSLFTLFAHVLGYHYLLVAPCTFVLATAVNYVLSIRHVFTSGVRYAKWQEVALVFLVSGGGLLINQYSLWFLVASLQLHLLLAKVTATAIVFFWNYTLRSRFIFAARRA